MNPGGSRRHRPRAYLPSGLHAARRAIEAHGSRALPTPDTPVGAELAAWRQSLIDDLGAPAQITTAQMQLIDMAVRSRVLVDGVDGYLFTLPSVVDKRHRKVWQVVRDRQALVSQLQSLLRDLGLERRGKVNDVDVILNRLRGGTEST